MQRVKSWKQYNESMADLFDTIFEEVLIICFICWYILPALLGFLPDDYYEEDKDGEV